MTTPNGSSRAPAWSADLPADEQQARDRLLEAAEACYTERGLVRTKMTHIALKAGVHRTTVYSYFPNRDAVLAACFVRAVGVVLDAAEPCWAPDAPFVDRLINATVRGLEAARKSPAMRILIEDGALPHTVHATQESELWRKRLHEALGERIAVAADAGEVRTDVSSETMARWVTRICFSLVAEPGKPEDGGDEGLLRAFLSGSLATPRASPGS